MAAVLEGFAGTQAMQVLILTPEPPYPLFGGGAYRIASLVEYFARFANVDLILISASGEPAWLPPGLIRSQQVIPLSYHRRGTLARYIRNSSRAIRGVPPLIDRLSGLEEPIARAIGGRHYDLGIVEHFWGAPYVDQMRRSCSRLMLDLHNVESVLHERCARLDGAMRNQQGGWLVRAGHRRFAQAARRLEETLLPRFSAILTASEEDARLVRARMPGKDTSPVHVYDNALPYVAMPACTERQRVVFSANFEYHPNIDATHFLVRSIWPEVRLRHPEMRLRLVGRGESFIRHLLPPGTVEETGIEVTGTVDNALGEIAQARVVVAPLRAGSGTRIKILEGWAAGRCVVATPLAAEGLEARHGANIVLATEAREFALAVCNLLENPVESQRLGAAGRRTFEHRYTWDMVWKTLDINLQLSCRTELSGYTERS
jgi:glycosyltransferase involved in cell wall biosynthesis